MKTLGSVIPILVIIILTAITSIAEASISNKEKISAVVHLILDMSNPAPTMDYDHDGLINSDEMRIGTNYMSKDTDKDGLNDKFETLHGFNPLQNENVSDADIDSDGLTTKEEQQFNGNPLVSDADNDNDGKAEIADNCRDWFNPSQVDTNNDGIGNACQAGDLNRDGELTQSDKILLENAINASGGIPVNLLLGALELCDTSGDGLCTRDDLSSLAQYLSGNKTGIRTIGPSNKEVWSKALTRLGYGADAWTINRLSALQTTTPGNTTYYALDSYILEQLNPQNIDDAVFENKLLPHTKDAPGANNNLAVYGKSYSELIKNFHFGAEAKEDSPSRITAVLSEGKFLRSIYSKRQLEAILSDFWFNHFNVNATDGNAAWTTPEYESMIRSTMFGQFENLLIATAKHPAMLDYLNLRESTKSSINENYARELLELHTVGTGTAENPNYDHDNGILPVARVLTGFQIDFNNADRPYKFQYYANSHDGGAKTAIIGGQTWNFATTNPSACGNHTATAGEAEGNTLLCLLARHEQTAENIGTKLIKRFFGDTAANEPSIRNNLNALTKNQWENTGGNLKETYKSLLSSDAFKASLYYDAKTAKRPQVMVASMARALGNQAEGSSNLIGNRTYENGGIDSSTSPHFKGLRYYFNLTGENPYQAGPPTGYSENASTWASVSNYIQHMRYVEKIISSTVTSENYTHYSNTASTSLLNGSSAEKIIDEVFLNTRIDENQGHVNTQLYSYVMSDINITGNKQVILPLRGIVSTPKFMSNQ